MRIKRSKIPLSTSLIFLILIIGCINLTNSVSEENILNVAIKNAEVYEYRTGISGDEEGASILVQANHFEISDIFRNVETHYEAVCKYEPKAGFSGTDYVKIGTRRGSDGASLSNKIDIIKIQVF
jgi:hypothetical protein